MADQFDVAVIGSGPGGYAAAIRCARNGANVALIEKGPIGGTCLNVGCIPSKTLLASAHTLLEIKGAKIMGIDVESARPNWQRIQGRRQAIVQGFRKGLTGLLKANNIRIINGRAIVTEPARIKVVSEDGSSEIEAKKIILATGSAPVEIPPVPLDGQTVITSKEALELEKIPESMVIIGGGVIGCEMACIYGAFGTRVTIVEALSRLMPMEDEWVGKIIERQFKKLGIETRTNQRVTGLDKSTQPVSVTVETGEPIQAQKVLLSVGRKAVCDQETIQNLDLQTNGPALKVDKKLQTGAPGVYAIGDAVGTTYLAHGAFAEAEVAAANATGGDEKIEDYSLIPRAVYSFPEIASVGKNEQTCAEEGIEVTVGKSFFKANGRSAAHNETTGEIRAIRSNATNKILGVTMVGAHVTELACAARILIGTSEDITDISFPHPTESEVLKEAAEDAFGLSLHNPPRP